MNHIAIRITSIGHPLGDECCLLIFARWRSRLEMYFAGTQMQLPSLSVGRPAQRCEAFDNACQSAFHCGDVRRWPTNRGAILLPAFDKTCSRKGMICFKNSLIDSRAGNSPHTPCRPHEVGRRIPQWRQGERSAALAPVLI